MLATSSLPTRFQCAIPNCQNKMHSRHLCNGHLDRWQRHGDPLADIPLNFVRPGRRVTIDGSECFEVPLSYGRFCFVDLIDAEWVQKHNWFCDRPPGRSGIYVIRTEGGKVIRLHRAILDAPSELEVDHVNRNGLDNRRCNIRLATKSQNNANKPLPGNKTANYRGVSRCKARNCWQAQFKIHGKNRGLGLYDDQRDAALAYDAFARHHFGEFAQLNFPCVVMSMSEALRSKRGGRRMQ